MSFNFCTTVRGGMPVRVWFDIGSPDPSAGLFTPFIEDLWLEVKGRRAAWLENRLTPIDWTALEDEVLEAWGESFATRLHVCRC